MRFGKKILLLIIICLLNSLIFILTVKITEKTTGKFNGTIKGVYKINKDNLEINDSESLKYFYEPKPLASNVITADWLDSEIKVTFNEEGLNDRYNYSLNKPEEVFRIVTLGDSHTEGVFVETKNTYSEVLEDLLNYQLRCKSYKKFEVINLGVAGYDLMYSYERFKIKGAKYDPDLVIWLINDWNFDKINEYYIPQERELSIGVYHDYYEFKRVHDSINKILEGMIDNFGVYNILKYQKRVLEKFSRLYNGKLLFLSYKYLDKKNEDIIREIVDKKISYNFIRLNFNFDYEDSFFPDNHPNESGYREIAEEIIETLIKNELKECEKLSEMSAYLKEFLN